MKIKVAILGSTGMLGSMVYRYLSEQPEHDLSVIGRPSFDAEAPFLTPILTDFLCGNDYAINCIGVIKPLVDERSANSVERAIQVNYLFPHRLAAAAETVGCRVLQIATDCVYSGREGGYVETSAHDALDIYGKSKSLGEVQSPSVHHLRCSIIGPEQRGHLSLLDWFLGRPANVKVDGFLNHLWNGVTTLAFARLCHGIILNGIALPTTQHIVPVNQVRKSDLLKHIAYFYHRSDILIDEVDAAVAIDRTLETLSRWRNRELWQAAGYSDVPYIQQMIEELAAYR